MKGRYKAAGKGKEDEMTKMRSLRLIHTSYTYSYAVHKRMLIPKIFVLTLNVRQNSTSVVIIDVWCNVMKCWIISFHFKRFKVEGNMKLSNKLNNRINQCLVVFSILFSICSYKLLFLRYSNSNAIVAETDCLNCI